MREDLPGRIVFPAPSGFWADEGGATAVEYGLVIAGIALAILTAVTAVGTNIGGTMNRLSSQLGRT